MKRSGSRLITKARSLRNISKTGYRFRYKLIIEQVDKLTTNSDVTLVWERGTKVISTKAVKVTKSRVAKFGNSILEQQVTLFKKKGGGVSGGFDEKVYRLSLKSKEGKVVSKINLDFARYAGVPSGSRRVGAQLSHGGQLVMKIESVFVEEVTKRNRGEKKGGSAGSRSEVGSGDNESTVGGGDVGVVDDLEELDIDDDFSDLNVESKEVKKSGVLVKSRSKLAPSESGGGGRQKRTNRVLVEGSTNAFKRQNSSTSGSDDMSSRGSEQRSRKRHHNTDQDTLMELERLRRENRKLRMLNDELDGGDRVDSETLSKLANENKRLRDRVADLEYQMKREPAYHEVVRDLKEAKMALALLNLEKEELHNDVVGGKAHYHHRSVL